MFIRRAFIASMRSLALADAKSEPPKMPAIEVLPPGGACTRVDECSEIPVYSDGRLLVSSRFRNWSQFFSRIAAPKTEPDHHQAYQPARKCGGNRRRNKRFGRKKLILHIC